MFSPYPHSGFCEICPGSNFLPGRHVGISVARKCCFQLLKLLACEVRSLPPLSLLFLVIVWCAVVHFAFRQILCKDKTEFLCTFFGVKSCFKNLWTNVYRLSNMRANSRKNMEGTRIHTTHKFIFFPIWTDQKEGRIAAGWNLTRIVQNTVFDCIKYMHKAV